MAIAVSYSEVRHHDFVNFDDNVYVTDNPRVSEGLTRRGVAWAFTETHGANWHPLTWLSHMLDSELYGLDAGGHHVTSVVLHALATVLLFAALRAMTGSSYRSAFVAALFALHPRNVESVAWVAERKDVLCAVFWTASMWAWAAYVRRPGAARYLAVALLFVLGLLSKPMMVTLPAALLLLDVWPLGRSPLWAGPDGAAAQRSWRQLVVEKLPLLALSAISSVVTFAAQRSGGAVAGLAPFPIEVRVANAALAYVSYLRTTLWPTQLAAFYPHRQVIPIGEALAAVALLAAVTVLVARRARTRPYLLVGWLWYLGTLVPVIGLVRVGSQAMADRFTYLPLIGIYFAVAWGVTDLFARLAGARRVLAPLAIGALAACAAVTARQVAHWRDSIALFEHTLAATGDNSLAETNLALALLDEGRIAQALQHAEAAVRLRPDEARPHVNHGVVLARAGRPAEARAAYERALQVEPDHAMAHLNLGVLLADQGEWEAAVRAYGEALRVEPDHAKAHGGMGLALAALGRRDEAIAHLRQALGADARLSAAANGLALLLEEGGHVDEALEVWTEALRRDPQEARLRHNRAALLSAAGRIAEAEADYREVVRQAPHLVDARVSFADVLARRGRAAEAAAELRAARAAAVAAGRADLVAAIDGRLAGLAAAPQQAP